MGKSKLEMEFKDADGKKFSLSLDEPREDITDLEVKAVMDDVIAKNIFYTAAGDIVTTVGARIITTTVEELEI
ncbi:MAG: DUF2922 domain-containing protein [Tissierellia bacterium]|nr:DUF2922 domain-containing protein [Tissierellia bacterium]